MIDKLSEIALLLDFYGNLLTDKQRMVMSYYYDEDMSLGEISEELEISRQAVYDLIKRSEKMLREYEAKLGLVKRFLEQKEKLLLIKQHLLSKNTNENISDVVDLIDEIINM